MDFSRKPITQHSAWTVLSWTALTSPDAKLWTTVSRQHHLLPWESPQAFGWQLQVGLEVGHVGRMLLGGCLAFLNTWELISYHLVRVSIWFNFLSLRTIVDSWVLLSRNLAESKTKFNYLSLLLSKSCSFLRTAKHGASPRVCCKPQFCTNCSRNKGSQSQISLKILHITHL